MRFLSFASLCSYGLIVVFGLIILLVLVVKVAAEVLLSVIAKVVRLSREVQVDQVAPGMC